MNQMIVSDKIYSMSATELEQIILQTILMLMKHLFLGEGGGFCMNWKYVIKRFYAF